MSKSESHKRAQSKAAGKGGRTEVPQPGGTRLDALSKGGRATEVERSGSTQGLQKAARRLQKAQNAGASQVVLQVPQKDMDAAAAAMRKASVKGTVKNMGSTKRRSVQ